jgi:hypothetical protein
MFQNRVETDMGWDVKGYAPTVAYLTLIMLRRLVD